MPDFLNRLNLYRLVDKNLFYIMPVLLIWSPISSCTTSKTGENLSSLTPPITIEIPHGTRLLPMLAEQDDTKNKGSLHSL